MAGKGSCDGRLGGLLRWPAGRAPAMAGEGSCDGRLGGLLRWPARAPAMAGWEGSCDGRRGLMEDILVDGIILEAECDIERFLSH
jgi:hypothetical protein